MWKVEEGETAAEPRGPVRDCGGPVQDREERPAGARSCGHGERLILAGFLVWGMERQVRAESVSSWHPQTLGSNEAHQTNPSDAAVGEPCGSLREVPHSKEGKRSRRFPDVSFYALGRGLLVLGSMLCTPFRLSVGCLVFSRSFLTSDIGMGLLGCPVGGTRAVVNSGSLKNPVHPSPSRFNKREIKTKPVS